MQSSWQPALGFTLRAEGGYTVDRGGPTYRGITLATYRTWTGDYAFTSGQLQGLSDDEVGRFYADHCWSPMGCDTLPAGLDLMVFDAGVMSGNQNSIYLLQRAVNVRVDGQIGPQTMAAINALSPLRRVELLRLQQWAYYGKVHDASDALIAAWRRRLFNRASTANSLVQASVQGVSIA